MSFLAREIPRCFGGPLLHHLILQEGKSSAVPHLTRHVFKLFLYFDEVSLTFEVAASLLFFSVPHFFSELEKKKILLVVIFDVYR